MDFSRTDCLRVRSNVLLRWAHLRSGRIRPCANSSEIGIFDVALAAGHVFDMQAFSQNQLESFWDYMCQTGFP